MNKFLDNILQSINKNKLSPLSNETIKSYKSRILNLLNEFKLINELNNSVDINYFIDNYNDVIEYLDNNISNTASKISYISSILYLLLKFDDDKNNKNDNKLIDNVRLKYQNKIKEFREQINLNKTNEKNENEIKNWVSYNELEKIFNDNYNKYIDIINEKKKVKINEYYNIQNMVIMSFYILIEPVRSSEIASLKYKNYDINDDNYIDIKKKILVFNEFKTSKTKNQLIIDLKQNKKLINLIKSFILFKNINNFNRDYLFNSNDNTNIDNSQLAKRLNHIIGKNVSSSMIRKIYLSDKYNDTLETINNINKSAKNMMNSTNVITKNYIKTN
jgi:integrase